MSIGLTYQIMDKCNKQELNELFISICSDGKVDLCEMLLKKHKSVSLDIIVHGIYAGLFNNCFYYLLEKYINKFGDEHLIELCKCYRSSGSKLYELLEYIHDNREKKMKVCMDYISSLIEKRNFNWFMSIPSCCHKYMSNKSRQIAFVAEIMHQHSICRAWQYGHNILIVTSDATSVINRIIDNYVGIKKRPYYIYKMSIEIIENLYKNNEINYVNMFSKAIITNCDIKMLRFMKELDETQFKTHYEDLSWTAYPLYQNIEIGKWFNSLKNNYGYIGYYYGIQEIIDKEIDSFIEFLMNLDTQQEMFDMNVFMVIVKSYLFY